MYRNRIINTDILVIDEISMLSAELFEKLNIICQEIRKNKTFFGGIQVVFTGDFLQLLPVFNKNKNIYKECDERLIIESFIFQQAFTSKNIILLKENFRQKNDDLFISLLNRVRNGTFTKQDITILNTKRLKDHDNNIKKCVYLVSSNKKAKLMNDLELSKLDSSDIKYEAIYNSSGKNKEIKELLINELQFQFNQRGIHQLFIKINARVMLIKNLDISRGLVNGALGTIKNIIYDNTINQYIPLVLFDGNENVEELIYPASWELEIDGCTATASQIPLMLAYSITIHKSQSLTLEMAILDLEDCFCDHQIYVALSRLRSLNGLYLESFNPSKITINKKMKAFIDTL
jgi:ATP-dependent DNA helicase PIF1